MAEAANDRSDDNHKAVACLDSGSAMFWNDVGGAADLSEPGPRQAGQMGRSSSRSLQ